MTSPLYSILITAYECHGKGVEFMKENLDAILSQTYRPLQAVISDHSKDDAIETYIKGITDLKGIDLIYVRFTENYGNPCANWNNAMTYATGDLWQPLALDDRLSDKTSVARIVEFTKAHPNAQWFACGHVDQPGGTFIPRWNSTILQSNTISGPSAIVMRASMKDVKMDPQFIWFLDLDWYYRLWVRAGGPPVIFPSVTWINRLHRFQLSNTVVDNTRHTLEVKRLQQKYGTPLPTT